MLLRLHTGLFPDTLFNDVVFTPVPLVHWGVPHTAYNIFAPGSLSLYEFLNSAFVASSLAFCVVDQPKNIFEFPPVPLDNAVVELYTGKLQVCVYVHVIVALDDVLAVSLPILPEPPFLFNVMVYERNAHPEPFGVDVEYIVVLVPPPIEYPDLQVQYDAPALEFAFVAHAEQDVAPPAA